MTKRSRAALIVKGAAGVMTAFAVVGLGLVFWPSVKPANVAAKSAVEKPVFVTASAAKMAPTPPTTVVATPAADPSPDRSHVDQLASALKGQGMKAAIASPASRPEPSPSPTPLAGKEARDCFAHGLVALAKGDLASARRWLEHAADEGEARAYMALGDAYNPDILARLGVIGAPGDASLARDYYGRAVAAGLNGAKDRLASLDTGAR